MPIVEALNEIEIQLESIPDTGNSIKVTLSDSSPFLHKHVDSKISPLFLLSIEIEGAYFLVIATTNPAGVSITTLEGLDMSKRTSILSTQDQQCRLRDSITQVLIKTPPYTDGIVITRYEALRLHDDLIEDFDILSRAMSRSTLLSNRIFLSNEIK